MLNWNEECKTVYINYQIENPKNLLPQFKKDDI
jgi:hypothetical protein